MKKNLTELVFIVDRSGSMAGLESDTIGGLNATLRLSKGRGVNASCGQLRRARIASSRSKARFHAIWPR